jgi:YVTN family beta-propeller protein
MPLARHTAPLLALVLACLFGSAAGHAQNAYITNFLGNTVSVVDTTTNTVTATIPVGQGPEGVAVSPDGSTVYVANNPAGTVSVIATASNTVTATIPVAPLGLSIAIFGLAVTPDGSTLYVANNGRGFGNIVVIATASNTVTATIPVGAAAQGAAMTPDGSEVYVANAGAVSVIATASNTVTATIPVGSGPFGLAVTPDGSTVYVANEGDGTVSVVDTATNTATATIPVGSHPTGVAVTPDGNQVFVANSNSNTVSVIATANNTVIAAIPVGMNPNGVAVAPDDSKVYVASRGTNTVSAIALASNTVIASIAVGNAPVAFGNFIRPPNLTVAATGSGSGTVTSSPSGIACGGGGSQCASPFAVGTTITLTASAAAGSSFTGWSGGGCSGTGSCVITPTADTTVIATFTTIPSSMLSVASAGSGAVTSNPSGINCGATCSASFETGTQVTLTATPAAGSSFLGWSSGGCSGTGTCIVTLSADTTVSATFATLPSVTLLVVPIGTGTGQVTSSPAGINCSPGSDQCAAPFAGATTVTLTASAAAGSSFSGWSGGGCSGTSSCVVAPTADTTVTANFTAIPSFELSVAPTGTGSGTVTSNPSGINCGATCNASFQTGTQVTLTASASAGSTFAGWSGGGCSGTGACVVAPTADTIVVATFTTLPSFTLLVVPVGTGAGQVTSSPADINCSASSNQCAASYAGGTAVTLTASAAAGSSFAGWSGGGCSGTATCVATLSADTTVTANFTAIPSFVLSGVPTGNGSGTVTSNPSGINCGGTCNASFQSGSQVVLTAAAAKGSTFAGWSGGGCNGIATCTVMLSANTAVAASFTQNHTNTVALVAAVLPGSRSVEIGDTATAFATVINSGPGTATACGIAPATSVPANFAFQTTDPSTNALTGTPNTPVDIAQGAAQSFVIALTPTAAFPPTDIVFNFGCTNASPVLTIAGVNTLNLSGSATPVPDIVALAASGDPGYVDIPGATGTGDFAVATVNLGIAAAITASADTGTDNLPVSLALCQTDPTSGVCLATPTATVTTAIAANATPTFGIFVTGSAAVPDSPGANRVFVRFRDSGGTLRGETSVAVRTQ